MSIHADLDAAEKICRDCGDVKSLLEFYVVGTLWSGDPRYGSACKTCTRERVRSLAAGERTPAVRTNSRDSVEAHCTGCDTTKPRDAFRVRKSGRQAGEIEFPCRACRSTRKAAYNKRNPEKVLAWEARRDNRLKVLRRHGLTQAEYLAMLDEQEDRCASCRDEFSETQKRVCIDHNHRTGTVRGILCHNCNVSAGLLNDEPARLRALADYLERTDD
jgi:hypothetical protein